MPEIGIWKIKKEYESILVTKKVSKWNKKRVKIKLAKRCRMLIIVDK